MSIFFVGAGPGDPDLITVKGKRLIENADVVLYAGSLIPEALLHGCKAACLRINTASLHLDQIIEHMVNAHEREQQLVRLHCGDISFYSAIAEQSRRLASLNIPYEMVPGVSSAAAAAAALGLELTLPETVQTLIHTRYPGKTPFPDDLPWSRLALPGVCLAVYLSINRIHRIVETLMPVYGPDMPVVVAYRVGWPDEMYLCGTLETIVAQVREQKITRTALILVGKSLDQKSFEGHSYLYRADQAHIYRPKYKRGRD